MTSPCKEDKLDLFYLPQKRYEITINPRKQFYSNKPIEEEQRFSKVVEHVSNFMDPFKDWANFQLWPEQSEPKYGTFNSGSEPRIHYHGVITFLDELSVAQFLMIGIQRLRNFCSFQINDYRPDHWPLYCHKQEEIMKPLCQHYNTPYSIRSDKPPFRRIAN